MQIQHNIMPYRLSPEKFLRESGPEEVKVVWSDPGKKQAPEFSREKSEKVRKNCCNFPDVGWRPHLS